VRHAFGPKTARFDGEIIETDTQHRVGQLTGNYRSLFKHGGSCPNGLLPGLCRECKILGRRESKRSPLLRVRSQYEKSAHQEQKETAK
jgi:hypothetical protein